MSNLIPYDAIDAAIADWLAARASNSPRTFQAYQDMMSDFRAMLSERNADLFSDPALVSLVAEQWAASSKKGKPVSASTFNLRLTALNSFYTYVARKSALSGRIIVNPISAIDRKRRQSYARPMPLDRQTVKKAMKAIDRTSLLGQRDYALLTIYLTTGRRLSEVINLTRGDLTFDARVLVDFQCKGGKAMRDLLTAKQSAALLDWLHAFYGADPASLPSNTPVWVSLSRSNRGAPLGIQSAADICEKRLGTSKVHALRHTFAVMMEEADAPISEIQKRLGHENRATTGLYLERLHAAENAYADALDDLLGTGD